MDTTLVSSEQNTTLESSQLCSQHSSQAPARLAKCKQWPTKAVSGLYCSQASEAKQ